MMKAGNGLDAKHRVYYPGYMSIRQTHDVIVTLRNGNFRLYRAVYMSIPDSSVTFAQFSQHQK